MRLQFLTVACAAFGLAGAASADIESLAADAAFQMSQKGELVVIDVRTPSEWAMTGMPRDSIGATLQDSDFVARARGAVLGDLEQPVAVICRSGSRSTSAAQKLVSEGFAHVFNISEGMAGHRGAGDGWIKRGLPTDPFNPPMR
ncbi:rhodanese-like domain-containing protein [Hyphomonas johnsonii]|jgi:rhodanese-related sulfurtransferase|uniref:Rhodanese-related sulfurtransferase n=1 Tax=Hyphomonas johnsonii MHS-2 TaxID=1280950 RepID=A0A059FTM7_9PROT|nr:rhodanese-like domain-containing protein [Hyphomonas johnsonii]KCZ93871.1 Rhodanese-related sulfurtransferase [Hyphomonas johnsonii MHS-2]